jgi:cysteinyl-tRNA synthetase
LRPNTEGARDQLGERLDNEKGGVVNDHAIFNAHSRKWEKAYLEDMEMLNVKEPDILTRVTENIPCIVTFVDKIVQKGLAYVSNGSVYLSIDAFKKAGHSYRKLKPGRDATADEMAESEGDLSADGSEKKHPNDFALWKASKPGEPEWESYSARFQTDFCTRGWYWIPRMFA